MKKLPKYIDLFESFNSDYNDIPYSNFKHSETLITITIPHDVSKFPDIYNNLDKEIQGIELKNNINIENINTFNNITDLTFIDISGNLNIKTITGFEKLKNVYGMLMINHNDILFKIHGFNILKNIHGELKINNNVLLNSINGFNNLNIVEDFISISNNKSLSGIFGFDKLHTIKYSLYISNNDKLIYLSIPYTLIKSACNGSECIRIYEDNYKIYYSEDEFINDNYIQNDFIKKFNPILHTDIVINQIFKNLKMWGSKYSIKLIINHLLSKGNYLYLIPEEWSEYIEEQYHHLYNAKYANTGTRGIAKMNTGRYLGMF